MSTVRQVRLLWTTFGLAVGAASFLDIRRALWSSTSSLADTLPSPPTRAAAFQVNEPVFGARAQQSLVRTWNSGVDRVFGDLVKYLSERNL